MAIASLEEWPLPSTQPGEVGKALMDAMSMEEEEQNVRDLFTQPETANPPLRTRGGGGETKDRDDGSSMPELRPRTDKEEWLAKQRDAEDNDGSDDKEEDKEGEHDADTEPSRIAVKVEEVQPRDELEG